jgi:mannose-6-phosphate isomerase-like protein (cupin superfamily)
MVAGTSDQAGGTRERIGPLTEEPRPHPYYEWQASEGIPIHRGFSVPDCTTAEVVPWERMGGNGAFITLGTKPGHDTGHYLCEIPARGSLKPMRHMFEEMIYILSGRGVTTVWNEGHPKRMFEWGPGSLIGIPLNAWYQHFNSGDEPARFISHNNAPYMMAVFKSERFLWDNPYVFDERYSGDEEYFSGAGKLHPGRVWETNFIPDARTLELQEWKERGAGGLNVMLRMVDSVLNGHISQFPIGTYKKGHVDPDAKGRDLGGGAHLLILDGVGFTLVWQPGDKDIRRIDWKSNTLIVSPRGWYHQHFNTGPAAARYLALRADQDTQYGKTRRFSDVSEREGGGQVEYEDENPEIHRIFEAELQEHSVSCKMSALSPFCTAGVPA